MAGRRQCRPGRGGGEMQDGGRGGQEWVGMEGERSKGEGKKSMFCKNILIFLFRGI